MIRLLTEADAETYRDVRLRALREEPHAFLATPEDDVANDLEETRKRFRDSEGGILGAFEAGALVGLCGFKRETAKKYRHKAFIWGMYVAPEARGRGLGRALLAEALRILRDIPELVQVSLWVTSVNPAARALYEAVGFRKCGVDPGGMNVGGRFVDEELMVLRLTRT